MASPDNLRGARVVVMGLGLHGGGAAAARYCSRHGAEVTVTDLQDEQTLRPSLDALSGLPLRFVLGTHDTKDFARADLIVKNPAVPRTAPLLSSGAPIATDISLFFERFPGRAAAITGTKGKSTTASILHHLLRSRFPAARLGGNITVSPLLFVDDIDADTPVVLELSSFQLGDLAMTTTFRDRPPRFHAAAITNLMADHQNYYHSMDAYWADKAVIADGMDPDSLLVLAGNDEWSRSYHSRTPRRVLRRAELLADSLGPTIDRALRVPGAHTRVNALVAASLAKEFALTDADIESALPSFPGVPHRLETVGSLDGVTVVNDSAATIAEAALAAVRSFQNPVHLIAGGSDKQIGLDPFRQIGAAAASIHLLEGTATPRIAAILSDADASYTGPHQSLAVAMDAARNAAHRGDTIILSPGCASFGMFLNEFDRGDQFRALVQSLSA